MKCPNCNREIPSDSKFCPDCGSKIVVKTEQSRTSSAELEIQRLKRELAEKERIISSQRQAIEKEKKEKQIRVENDYYGNVLFTIRKVKFKMIRVNHGEFMMGAASNEKVLFDDYSRPVHKVCLTKDYYIAETPVTQELWNAVMGGDVYCYFKGPQNPVHMVSWDKCMVFIKRINELTGKQFRLPTEAEWEFAARGGNSSSQTRYAGSNSWYDVGWFKENSNDMIHPVKTKRPNELGIYDMCGNVCEWCMDYFGHYSSIFQTDPKGPCWGDSRVRRGGAYSSCADHCLIPERTNTAQDYSWLDTGFRLALSE